MTVSPKISRAHKLTRAAILTAYLVLAFTYSVVVPPFEASDELWHYPTVQYLATHGLALPPQDPANPGAWRQEGSQPPLYYLIAAMLTAPIDTSDLETVRRINPHADIGVVLPDRNINMIAHRADAEAFPWRGAILALHIARGFSIVLGALTIGVTYLLTRELFPESPAIWLGAMAFNAFLPMFVFIAGSVNNDNLSTLLGGALTLAIVRLLKRERPPTPAFYAAIGVLMGAGLLAKLNLGFFVVLIALSLLIVSLRMRTPRPLLVGGMISGALTVAIAGWWYWRNWQLYGDPTGLEMFLAIVGRRAIPANLTQLWAERDSFLQAFWGFFGGVNVPLPPPVYLVLNVFGGLAIVGVIAGLVTIAVRRGWPLQRWLPAIVTLLWIGVTFVSYVRWTAETPASQGRLMFGTLSAICAWAAWGIARPFGARWQPFALAIPAIGLAVVGAAAPFIVIAPAYATPPPIEAADAAPLAVFIAPDSERGRLALLSSRTVTASVLPEGYIELELEWRIDEAFTREWSVFAHLTTPDGVIIGQRDRYPGFGTLATSDLQTGRAWRETIAVRVPTSAYAPMPLTLVIGVYHLESGARLTANGVDESIRVIDDTTIAVGRASLTPRVDPDGLAVPNSLRLNFGDQLELVGYELSDLSPTVGGSTTLTLYWRTGSRPIARDYTIFAHIINPATLTQVAGSDSTPAQGARPTISWAAGEIITDSHTLNINPEAPPGVYEVEIGAYWQDPIGTFNRLRVGLADGSVVDDYAYLSRVRIDLGEVAE